MMCAVVAALGTGAATEWSYHCRLNGCMLWEVAI